MKELLLSLLNIIIIIIIITIMIIFIIIIIIVVIIIIIIIIWENKPYVFVVLSLGGGRWFWIWSNEHWVCVVQHILRHHRDENYCEVYSVRILKLIIIFTVRRMVSLSASWRGKL